MAQIQTADGHIDLEQVDRERIVEEDFGNLAVLETDQQRLLVGRSADDFDVADRGFQRPLAFLDALEIDRLQFLLLWGSRKPKFHQIKTIRLLCEPGGRILPDTRRRDWYR